jgi:hypothetical protein
MAIGKEDTGGLGDGPGGHRNWLERHASIWK